jgi:hypothetical protein
MTDRPPSPENRAFDPADDERPGSDPGAAYDRAVEADEVEEDQPEGDQPGVGDVYRSGS